MKIVVFIFDNSEPIPIKTFEIEHSGLIPLPGDIIVIEEGKPLRRAFYRQIRYSDDQVSVDVITDEYSQETKLPSAMDPGSFQKRFLR